MPVQIVTTVVGLVLTVLVSLAVTAWMRRSEERMWARPVTEAPAFVDPEALIGYDRRNRPSLKLGPALWWGMGLWFLSVIPFGLLVAARPWGVDGSRWVGGVMFVVSAGFWIWWFVHFLRRWRRYLHELRRRGQRHKQPPPPPAPGPGLA